ncbi:MAG: fructose-bisphosphate aldolase, class [Thermoproteota archaeon]|nr:fructose-bisphosphate aldolase, class [Thermoproteota archaeon]
MDVGKERRLRRILGSDGRTVMVPMDHGVSSGPLPGLVNMQETVARLADGGADAVIVHKGIARIIDVKGMALIVHLSASSDIGPDPDWKVQVTSVKQAIKLGADGISIHVNVGGNPHENSMLADMGRIADECEEYGIPLLAMMYPRGSNIKSQHDVTVVKHVARLGAELGADLVKTNYTGSPETFREIVQGCPVPVIIAGGPKAKTEEDVFRMVYDSVQAGGIGVSIGRNVFQHQNQAVMVKSLSAIVHQKASVEEALKILGEK